MSADDEDLPVAEVLVGQPLVNQLVVRTGAMANETPSQRCGQKVKRLAKL